MAAHLTAPAALDAESAATVRRIADAIEARDGQPPLSDHALTHLQSELVAHALVSDGAVVGYGQLEGTHAEIAGTAEVAALILDSWAEQVDTAWSHGTRSFLAPLLEARGFTPMRALHQLRRSTAVPVEPLELPAGVTIERFRVGIDEADWLRVNAAAFADHPEQAHVTLADLQALEAETWFDPRGFLLARRDTELLGYHWTKVHADGLGEVYVIGIGPAAQGLGLGRIMLNAGLRHLAEIGCPEVLLYVDDTNSGAMSLYESVGFTRHDTDTQWQKPRS